MTRYAKARSPEEQGDSCRIELALLLAAQVCVELRNSVFGLPGLRLVAGTLDHRQARIFREVWIAGRTLALIERRATRRLDLSHVLAVAAQSNAC